MTEAVQLPFRTGQATKVGRRRFRKQILPVGSIDYNGRKIDFTREYLADLADNFDAKAYDQVPFLLADPETNAHTADPDRFRGEVTGLELAQDGLYAHIELSKPGAELVKDNPRLGVSARIVTDPPRTDGQHFTRAVQHVLGTMDPRVTGMKAWEPLDLSNEPDVVNLTAATYQGEGTMPELTDEELTAFRTFLADQAAATAKAEADAKTAPTKSQDEIDADLEAQVEAAMAAAETPEPAGASLSTEQQAAIDLANSKATSAIEGHSVLRAELDAEKFKSEHAAYVAAGVPPALVDLAQPLMTGSHVIELSNSETVDAGDIVRKMLDEYKGLVDLSAETPSMQVPTDSEKEVLDRYAKQFPAK